MTKIDKILAAALGIAAMVSGGMGLGIYMFNEDAKITDREVATNLLMSAASIAGLKALIKD